MTNPASQGPEPNLRVRRAMFLILLILVTAAFFGMVRNLLMACFWAVVLAIIFAEPHNWLERKLPGRSNLNAVIMLTAIIIIVVIPVGLVSKAIINESIVIYEAVEKGDLHPRKIITNVQERFPMIEGFVGRLGISREEQIDRIVSFGTTLANSATRLTLRYTQNVIKVAIDLTLMLYLLFFFLRDGEKLVETIKRTIPMGDVIEERLFKRFTEVSRATVKGTLVVAIVQGSLGGIIFAILGIPAATLWGVLMIFLSLLPVGGAAIVWVPAAIILFANGEAGKAAILVVCGILLIGLIDNILRPRLVSRDTKMPDYFVLLATLGGLASFGLAGFVVGPVIAALFLTCWEITGQLFGGSAK